MINPYREPGLERYWIPSVAESALFGTRIADEFFQVHTGGDRAFIAGVIKHLIAEGWADDEFIGAHTSGFGELKAGLAGYEWELLEAASGTPRAEMLRFARLLAESRTAVFVWSMGITQHARASPTCARSSISRSPAAHRRPQSGLMPIRGHSGVQGGAEVARCPISCRAASR